MRQFRLPYDLIVLDLEANQPSDKIIEIGAVKVTRDGGIHPDEFSALVYLDEPLSEFVSKLTGITAEDLELSEPFPDVMKMFEEWAKKESKNIVLASWGNWDIPCLRNECKRFGVPYPFRGKSIDIKSIGVWVNLVTGIKAGSDGLGKIMTAWQVPFEGTKHRARDDAKNTAQLFLTWWKHYREAGEILLKSAKKLGVSE